MRQARALTRNRRGITMLVVIVILSVGMLLLAGAVRSLVDEHRQCRLRHTHRQCRLATTAALDRAAARLNADSNYNGETWTIAADDVGLPGDIQVAIELDRSDAGKPVATATTTYPAEGTPRITDHQTRALSVRISEDTTRSSDDT